jgi:hypothetical protein
MQEEKKKSRSGVDSPANVPVSPNPSLETQSHSPPQPEAPTQKQSMRDSMKKLAVENAEKKYALAFNALLKLIRERAAQGHLDMRVTVGTDELPVWFLRRRLSEPEYGFQFSITEYDPTLMGYSTHQRDEALALLLVTNYFANSASCEKSRTYNLSVSWQ